AAKAPAKAGSRAQAPSGKDPDAEASLAQRAEGLTSRAAKAPAGDVLATRSEGHAPPCEGDRACEVLPYKGPVRAGAGHRPPGRLPARSLDEVAAAIAGGAWETALPLGGNRPFPRPDPRSRRADPAGGAWPELPPHAEEALSADALDRFFGDLWDGAPAGARLLPLVGLAGRPRQGPAGESADVPPLYLAVVV